MASKHTMARRRTLGLVLAAMPRDARDRTPRPSRGGPSARRSRSPPYGASRYGASTATGSGAADTDGDRRSYERFDCVGGTRPAWEAYDTIAVFYELRPLEEYVGLRSRHRLTSVRFVGGPGIP